jgi:hypothetical protein
VLVLPCVPSITTRMVQDRPDPHPNRIHLSVPQP